MPYNGDSNKEFDAFRMNNLSVSWNKIKEKRGLEMDALIVISVFVYLIHIGKLSYYRDDWYYMYDGMVGGGQIFVEMFLHLRPARGPLFEFLFNSFGTIPLSYHFLLYLLRVAGGVGALWLFRILWPRQRSATFFMALLFLIYPGFLWWIQGFEFQPMVLSVDLQIFSILFTLKAIQSQSRFQWILWLSAALICGWAYLSFVEYAIGMEVFRWMCVYLLISRSSKDMPLQRILQTIRRAAVTLLIPAMFLIWRVFIFENERKAADISLQTGAVLNSPGTLLWWVIHFLQSVLNVSVIAWASFNEYFYTLRLKDALFAIAWTVIVIGLSYLTYRLTYADDESDPSTGWQLEAISMGLIGVSAGVIPLIVANRVVTFDRFSHYALPASLAAVTFVVGMIYSVRDIRIRVSSLFLLIGLSVLTHGAVALQAQNEEAMINNFWHQVAWRVPSINPGTVLLVNYAGMNYAEGSDIVWGPANFIYYPEKQSQVPIVISVAAARMEADTPKNILEGAELQQNYIVVNDISYDFSNLLVMSMPSTDSCVHVLDGRWEELSVRDTALVGLAASRSKIERVVPDENQRVPPATVFGKEPPHAWCYYYQKAQLARQQEDWEAISKISSEVDRLNLQPNDQIEWMPFLQAAAALADEKQIKQISTRINTEQLYKQQACQNLRAMTGLSSNIQNNINELFCGGNAN
ncbi:MAG TPA: hypothetical protein VN843_14085 [Anaerolineales bacterium]|nr:hypothetical protein [Anaerolineales bacterium]